MSSRDSIIVEQINLTKEQLRRVTARAYEHVKKLIVWKDTKGVNMEQFDHTKKHTWNLVVSGGKSISVEALKEMVKEEMWKELCGIIPTEFRNSISEVFKVTETKNLRKVKYTCKYKPLVKE